MVATNGAASASLIRGPVVSLSLFAVSLTVLTAPLPLGSVSRWAQAVLTVLVCVLALVAVMQSRRDATRGPGAVATAFFAVFVAVGLVQIVPLPLDVVRALSPEAAAAHESIGDGGRQWATLSLDLDSSIGTLLKIAVFAGLFFVVASVGRGLRGVAWLSGAIVVAGLAQVGIGAYRQWSGATSILGHEPTIVSPGLTGTFLSADHFAGFVGITLFIAMGAWLGARGGTVAAEGRRRTLSMMCLACAAFFATALVLSRSRSALAAGCCTGLVFIVLVGRVLGLRRRTIAMLATLASILVIGQLIALELIISWVDGGSPVVVDWADRFDLYRSALAMASHFPWLGCGLGAGAAVFPRFQSDRFGDRIAEHLHGDWLQVFSEAGVIGGAALLLACLAFWIAAYRRIIRVTSARRRWLGIGALTSLAFVATHGLFEGSLLRVTANGVAAAVCAGIAHAAGVGPRASVPSPRRGWVVPLCRGAAAATILGCVVTLSLRRATAEFEFNCHRAAIGAPLDRYFFLDCAWLRDPEIGQFSIDTAVRLNPRNARYAAALADWQRARRADFLRREAERVAAERFGVSQGPAFGELVAALVRARVQEGDEAVRDFGESARSAMDRAIASRPTCAELRIARATLAFAEGRTQDRDLVRRDAILATRFAPEKPSVLIRAAGLLLGAAADGTAHDDADRATTWLTHALAADPVAAASVVDVVASAGGRVDLSRVVPEGGAAYRAVVDRLCRAARLKEAARVLASRSLENAPLDERYYRAVRSVEVAERLGRLEARRRTRDDLLRIEREQHNRVLRDARDGGSDPVATCERILGRDPGHLGALIALLDERLARRDASVVVRDGAASLAVRLAGEVAMRAIRGASTDDADGASLARLGARLAAIASRGASEPHWNEEHRIFAWTASALESLSGHHERANARLDALVATMPQSWRFAHLVFGHAAAESLTLGRNARGIDRLGVAASLAPRLASWSDLASALGRPPLPRPLPIVHRACGVLFGGSVELVACNRETDEDDVLITWWRVRASAPGMYRVTLTSGDESASATIGSMTGRVETLIPVRIAVGEEAVRCRVWTDDACRLLTETGAGHFVVSTETVGVDR